MASAELTSAELTSVELTSAELTRTSTKIGRTVTNSVSHRFLLRLLVSTIEVEYFPTYRLAMKLTTEGPELVLDHRRPDV